MATYKVLQDIEAEDKLLGPLTLKQFIFAAITIVLGFICFLILTSPAPTFIKAPLLVPFVPGILLFGFMAAPIGRDQPNDIWLLARLRFLFKPRTRIWNQDGINQLVTITAPKREVHVYTNGLTQTEVKSRLQALANTVDSRGWAIKNVNTNMFAQPGYLSDDSGSDRLIDPSTLPQDVPASDVTAADDMLDTANNTTAQNLDRMVQASTQAHHQKLVTKMKQDDSSGQSQTPQDYWFMNQTTPQGRVPQDYATFASQQVVAPGGSDAHPAAQATPDEEALAEELATKQQRPLGHVNDHIKTIQPLHDRDGNIIKAEKREERTEDKVPATYNGWAIQPSALSPQPSDLKPEAVSPALQALAHNDDLNVATIARQAKRISEDDGEVVVNLH